MSADPTWLQGIEGATARKLIESDESLIRVVAGPGTGKTTCLKRRTKRLVTDLEVPPSHIFVGTFTRAIAKELKAELGEEVTVSTLHSLAYRLLRENPSACQGMKLRFLLAFEEDCLLHDIRGFLPEKDTVSNRRKKLRELEATRSRREDFENEQFATAVRNWLIRHKAMLVGEVVHLAVLSLESSDISPGRLEHVIIDEYQDLTSAEQALVDLLVADDGSLTILGDPNQSIYGFRYNHPRGVSSFPERWPHRICDDLTFDENRRCGQAILDIANLMIASMPTDSILPQQPLSCQSGRAGRVASVFWESVEDEIFGLARYVRERPTESFLILVPRRVLGYRLKREIGADATTAFHEEVLEHPVAQEAFTAASIIADPNDAVAIRAWLGFHGTKAQKAGDRNRIAYSSLSSGTLGLALLRQIADQTVHPQGKGKMSIRQRARRAVGLIQQEMEPQEIFKLIFREDLANVEDDDEKREFLINDLRELREAGLEVLDEQPEIGIKGAMNTLRYRIATRAPLRSQDDVDHRVKIMTLHGAKGLEADNVVIAGVADQIVPGDVSRDDRDPVEVTEEQRRLLFVAITRAKESLVLSWPRFIPTSDNRKIMPRIDPKGYVEHQGEPGIKGTRSRLLPDSLSGVMPGEQL